LGLEHLELPVPPVREGTADIVTGEWPDHWGEAVLEALALRVEGFRKAGYSLPLVDKSGAYWQIT